MQVWAEAIQHLHGTREVARGVGRSSSGTTTDARSGTRGRSARAGWSDAFGRKPLMLLKPITVDDTLFEPDPPDALCRAAHWVEPRFVAEVPFAEWTDDGKIRHPSLRGFRADKRSTEILRERQADSTTDTAPGAFALTRYVREARMRRRSVAPSVGDLQLAIERERALPRELRRAIEDRRRQRGA